VSESGAFSAERLAATLGAFPGVGDDVDQPEPVRFLRGVARVVRKRVGLTPPGDAPSVFLLMPSVPDALVGTVDVHPMLDNGLTDVEGQLWFVGAPVVHGRSAPLAGSDAEIWQTVRDLGLAGVPAVVYDPRPSPPEVRYYPEGLQAADTCAVTRVEAVSSVTLDEIFAVIDRIHLRQLVTPDAQPETGKLWADVDRGYPVAKAELTIQMYLETALNAGFPTCTVRREQTQTVGRLDLELEQADPQQPGSFIRHAVLELKVLRSRNSTGKATSAAQTARWVDEGVDQAYAYRLERAARASALCCFDMRADHSDPFGSVVDRAAKLQVALRAWPLYSTAKQLRAVLAASAPAGGEAARPAPVSDDCGSKPGAG
jgi:hypothetical protein